MFILDEQRELTLPEFLEDYNLDAYLGYLQKTAPRAIQCKNSEYTYMSTVKTGTWSVYYANKQDYSDKEDMYFCYNPLAGKIRRKKQNVYRLATLYVDLDIGRDDNPFETDIDKVNEKQRVVDALEENVFGKTAPAPNYICDSGRGLYLIYKIYQNEDQTKQEHVNASGRWARINTYLTEAFSWYSSDSAVSTDTARVLRAPGSINSKSGTRVKFFKYSDAVYTLHSIERDYMYEPTDAQIDKLGRMESSLDINCNVRNKRSIRRFMADNEKAYVQAYRAKEPTETQIEYASDIAMLLHIDLPKFRTQGGADRFIKKYEKAFKEEKQRHRLHRLSDEDKTKAMLAMRLKRLSKVISEASKNTYREIGLFLYRLFACELTEDKKLAEEMTAALIDEMAFPINKKEALRTTKSAEKYFEAGKIYKITDERLAAKFGMTVDEWRALIPREKIENKELKSERNKRYYAHKLEKVGETSKQNKIMERREELARLLSIGKNKNEICSELGISIRTYYGDVKAMESDHACEQETIEIDCAKKSDSPSNSGPIGPCATSESDVLGYSDRFDYFFSSELNQILFKKSEAKGEWSVLWPQVDMEHCCLIKDDS